MPYSGTSDKSLPDNVKALPADAKAQWVEVFNSAYAACEKDGGEDCESSAFAQAWGVVDEREENGRSKMATSAIELEVKLNKQTLISRFVEAFMDAIEVVKNALVERRIKDVESWDGSAANYSDTDAYCAACLIDVNAAAGRDTKAQSHCMLPVREHGDSADTYVRQAVHAAVGGRGIGQVKRPSDVPEAAWNSAVKSAASKLISAYGQMDEDAPESLYPLAGKSAPARAKSMTDIYMTAYEQLEYYDGGRIMDIFHEGSEMFAIVNRDGALYKVPLMLNDSEELEFGEPVKVQISFPETGERQITVTRQADGRYRLTGIACTAILNRSNEIDTRALFDKFIERFNAGIPAQVDLLHIDGSDVGDVDYLARDGYGLIFSSILRSDSIGDAVARGIGDEPAYWGNSILYKPMGGEMVTVAGVNIPAYTDGVLRKITILPEKDAAALFTTVEVKTMNGAIKETLRKLIGDNAADELEMRVDGVNRKVQEDGLVARETQEALPDSGGGGEAETEVPATEGDVIVTMRSDLDSLKGQIENAVDALKKISENFEARLGALERSEDERKRAWLADLPERKRQPETPIWRPRDQVTQENSQEETAAQRAERNWKAMGGK